MLSDRRLLGVEFLLAAAFLAAPCFLWSARGDVESDEAVYSYAADQIVETGDWLTPVGIYRGHPPFFEKPPLKFWLVAAGRKLGLPDNDWGHRFFDAVFGAATFGYLVALGRLFGGRWAGFLSALIFFAFGQPLLEHGIMNNQMESCLILQYTGSIYHFTAWAQCRRRAWLHVPAISLLFVLGFMTKFVAALFLPLILVAAVIVSPRLRERVPAESRPWLAGLALAGGLIAPWFIYQHLNAGDPFWREILGIQVVRRLTHFVDPSHVHPWYAYLQWTAQALIRSGAAVAVLLGVGYLSLRPRRSPEPGVPALGLWWVIPVVAMSAMTSKLVYYLYPYLPPLAVIGGVGLAQLLGYCRTKRWSPAWLLFALALVPIFQSYARTLEQLRSRPEPFSELKRCLEDRSQGARVRTFFRRPEAANHSYAHYDLVEYRKLKTGVLDRTLFGKEPQAVWLSQAQYREALNVRDRGSERLQDLEALFLHPAQIRLPAGEYEVPILLFPPEHSACVERLLREGAERVTVEAYLAQPR